eukprot:5957292-Prymnesium_polylepis.1
MGGLAQAGTWGAAPHLAGTVDALPDEIRTKVARANITARGWGASPHAAREHHTATRTGGAEQ